MNNVEKYAIHINRLEQTIAEFKELLQENEPSQIAVENKVLKMYSEIMELGQCVAKEKNIEKEEKEK